MKRFLWELPLQILSILVGLLYFGVFLWLGNMIFPAIGANRWHSWWWQEFAGKCDGLGFGLLFLSVPVLRGLLQAYWAVEDYLTKRQVKTK
jgi:branched-subunit amino acid permease